MKSIPSLPIMIKKTSYIAEFHTVLYIITYSILRMRNGSCWQLSVIFIFLEFDKQVKFYEIKK